MKNEVLPYKSFLIPYAKENRKSMTKGEVILWKRLRAKQLGVKFSRQIAIDSYIIDFYSKELKLAIEVDGITHQLDEVRVKDEQKDKRLNSLGIQVLRIDDQHIFNDIENVIKEIVGKIDELKNG